MAGGPRTTTAAFPGPVASKKHNPAPPVTKIARIGGTHATHGACATLVRGVGPEVEVFDPAMLFNTADLAEGVVEQPPHARSVFGVARALPARCDVPGSEAGGLPPGAARTAAKRARASLGPRAAA